MIERTRDDGKRPSRANVVDSGSPGTTSMTRYDR